MGAIFFQISEKGAILKMSLGNPGVYSIFKASCLSIRKRDFPSLVRLQQQNSYYDI